MLERKEIQILKKDTSYFAAQKANGECSKPSADFHTDAA
jgi:hypothetical protein